MTGLQRFPRWLLGCGVLAAMSHSSATWARGTISTVVSTDLNIASASHLRDLMGRRASRFGFPSSAGVSWSGHVFSSPSAQLGSFPPAPQAPSSGSGLPQCTAGMWRRQAEVLAIPLLLWPLCEPLESQARASPRPLPGWGRPRRQPPWGSAADSSQLHPLGRTARGPGSEKPPLRRPHTSKGGGQSSKCDSSLRPSAEGQGGRGSWAQNPRAHHQLPAAEGKW